MKKKDLAELAITRAIETEALLRVVETGEVQLRRTFNMYLELLDKVNGNGRERTRYETGIENNV
jgi:hypothetical protein